MVDGNPHRDGSATARLFDRLFDGELDFRGDRNVCAVRPVRRPDGSYRGIQTQRNGWRWIVEAILELDGKPPRQVSMGSDTNVTRCADATLSAFVLLHSDIEIVPVEA